MQHAAAVCGFVLGLMADRVAAEDVFQEVFLTVAQKEAEFQRDGNFFAWVRGIARNKVLEHCRRHRKKPLLFDEHLLELVAEAVDVSDERLERRREALSRACSANWLDHECGQCRVGLSAGVFTRV